MRLNGVTVTLSNYPQALEGYSKEVWDEVVTALYYGVDLSPFIHAHQNNPELLRQIKWGLVENLDARLLAVGDAEVLRKIRGLASKGVDLENIHSLPLQAIDREVLDLVLEWVEKGADLQGYNLRVLSLSAAKAIGPHVVRGEDLREFCVSLRGTPLYFNSLIHLKANGVAIDRFLETLWAEDVVVFLAHHANSRFISPLLDVVTPAFPRDVTEGVFALLRNGVSPDPLLASGSPTEWPHEFHFGWLLRAKEAGLDLAPFSDASLSEPELAALFDSKVRLQTTIKRKLRK